MGWRLQTYGGRVMSEETEEVESGRLRAEDRRGRVYHHFEESRAVENESAPSDPEEDWKEEEGGSSRRLMRGITILVLAGIFGTIIDAVTRSKAPEQSAAESRREPGFEVSASAEEIKAEAERVISGFMSAKTHEERCNFLIGGSDRLSQLEEYYSRSGSAPPTGYGGRCKIEPYALEGRALYAGVATDPSPGKFWTFLLSPAASGFLIDWEASVGYGALLWKDFLLKKPAAPVQMRVVLTGIPAPPEWAISDEKYRTFEVSFRGQKDKAMTFIERKSPAARKLARFVPPSVPHPVNVILRWSEDHSGEPQLKILQVVHNYWVRPDVPHEKGKLQ